VSPPKNFGMPRLTEGFAFEFSIGGTVQKTRMPLLNVKRVWRCVQTELVKQ